MESEHSEIVARYCMGLSITLRDPPLAFLRKHERLGVNP